MLDLRHGIGQVDSTSIRLDARKIHGHGVVAAGAGAVIGDKRAFEYGASLEYEISRRRHPACASLEARDRELKDEIGRGADVVSRGSGEGDGAAGVGDRDRSV